MFFVQALDFILHEIDSIGAESVLFEEPVHFVGGRFKQCQKLSAQLRVRRGHLSGLHVTARTLRLAMQL